MTITREDAELIAAALGASTPAQQELGGWTFKIKPNVHWHVSNEDWLMPILDLAKRAGPKPRSAEDEAEILKQFLGANGFTFAKPWFMFLVPPLDAKYQSLNLAFDTPLWNKLLKLAKEAKT